MNTNKTELTMDEMEMVNGGDATSLSKTQPLPQLKTVLVCPFILCNVYSILSKTHLHSQSISDINVLLPKNRTTDRPEGGSFVSIKYFPVIDMVATGRKITELRKARGLSVAALQEYFGFEAPQAIYKWQKGQSLPSTDNLVALACLFEVSIEDILIQRPQIQVLSQDHSCDSGRFGTFCFSIRMFHILFKGFAEAVIVPPIGAVTIAPRQVFSIYPLSIDEAA